MKICWNTNTCLKNNNNYRYYLEDCLELLLERAQEARDDANKSKDDFTSGRALGYYEVVDSLLNRLEAYGIEDDMKEIIKNHPPLGL
jgi:hypothetical protein